jgi:hypothetical protein
MLFRYFYRKIVKRRESQGRLNPAKRVFEVTDWNSRQFGEPDLQFMTETLVHWGKHCNQFVNMLAAQANEYAYFLSSQASFHLSTFFFAVPTRKLLHLLPTRGGSSKRRRTSGR